MTEIKRPWMARVDKNEMVRLLNEQLTLNPKAAPWWPSTCTAATWTR